MTSPSPTKVASHLDVAAEVAKQHRLHGRNREVAQLLETLDRINGGQGEVLLVPGLSGSGKTALANVLREPTSKHNGYFLTGKFNQYDRNVPYVAWRQALAEFCEFVAQEDDEQREAWRGDILGAVEGNGQLLVDLVPEFALLLGKQMPVDAISPQEARHRFAGVIRALLAVICRPEHPLVLFLDDWQWADAASLHLLTQLQIGSTLRYILVIAAYRSDEVDERHGLTTALSELRSQSTTVETTAVDNLGIEEIQALVAEAISEFDIPSSMANDIHVKSKGNPFFAHTLVEMLRSTRSETSAEGEPTRLDAGVVLPDDIVNVFTQRIDQLDIDCQELLSLAACLGHRFDTQTLALISGRTAKSCQLLLEMAIPDLIVAIKGTRAKTSRNQSTQWYQFLHDRVQQAAYARIPSNDMPETRLGIARKMEQRLSREQVSDRICEVVEHFNAGATLVKQADEHMRGVWLNVEAARRVRSATAFRAALIYHRAARDLIDTPELDERLWSEQHELAMALFLEQAETEFLEGDVEEAEKCVRVAAARAYSSIQKAEALATLIVQNTLRARYADAIAIGREALLELGITLPERCYEAARDREIAETRQNLAGRTVADLVNLPTATDETMQAAAKVLITMGPPCYRAHQELWSVIVPRVVNLTLMHGSIPQIGYSHTAFAGLLGWVSNDYETGCEYTKVASQLMSGPLASSSDKSVFHLMIGSSTRHWFEPLRNSSEDYRDAIQTGRQSGNLQYAAYAFGHNMYCRYFQGTPLDELIRESQSSLVFSNSRHNQWAIDLLQGGLRIFSNLSSRERDADADEAWEASFLTEVKSRHNQQVACIYCVMKAQKCLVLGQLERALELSDQAQPLIYTVGTQGLLPWAEHVFSRVLIMTGLYPTADKAQQERWRGELDDLVGQLKVWASHCPPNFGHKHLLASADLARLDGRHAVAIDLYERAIESARESGFVQWEGLANERASQYWQALGNGRLEQVYWQHAFRCYEQWGAHAKLESMLVEYRSALSTALQTEGVAGVTREQSDRLLNRHQNLVRAETIEMASTRERARIAEELTTATDSLRADVAARRRTTTELRQERDEQKELNDKLEQLAEELRYANQSLEQTNRELEEFVHAASHDLRSPLHGISQAAWFILEDDGETISESSKEYLDKLLARVRRMGTLLDDLLTYSRVGRKERKLEKIDTATLLEDVVDLLAIPDSFQVSICDDLPVFTTFATPLRQVFMNLVGNAVKHHDKGEGKIALTFAERNDYFEFRITDDGPGIDGQYHEQIFDMFKTLQSKDKVEGSGMGLAIIRKQVQHYGGDISVESQVGDGTTFVFTWPRSITHEAKR